MVEHAKDDSNLLATYINYGTITLSVAALIPPIFDLLAFKPESLITWDPFPLGWTLITCRLFETNLIFLALQLLVINYLAPQVEAVWTPM